LKCYPNFCLGVQEKSEKSVEGFPVSGIQNRNGIGEIGKSERRKTERKRDWNE
jgi:hypothetical protein